MDRHARTGSLLPQAQSQVPCPWGVYERHPDGTVTGEAVASFATAEVAMAFVRALNLELRPSTSLGFYFVGRMEDS